MAVLPSAPPLDLPNCSICLGTPEGNPSPLRKREVAISCDHKHSFHLQCLIQCATQKASCPNCRAPFDIVDPIIFANLQAQEGESVEKRRKRIAEDFNMAMDSDKEFANYTQFEKTSKLSILFWGNPTLFIEGAKDSPEKKQMRDLLKNKVDLQTYLQGKYVEQLEGESNALYNGRLNLFARRVAPHNSGDNTIRNNILTKEGVTLKPEETVGRIAVFGTMASTYTEPAVQRQPPRPQIEIVPANAMNEPSCCEAFLDFCARNTKLVLIICYLFLLAVAAFLTSGEPQDY